MLDYTENIPLAEVFKVRPNDFANISIEALPFSIRVQKRLRNKSIYTVKDLLMVDIASLKSIQGFGADCLNQIISYCENLAQHSDYEKLDQTVSEFALFTNNKNAIAIGDFSFSDGIVLSEDEKKILGDLKKAYNIFGANMIYNCVYSAEKINPILETLSVFSKMCLNLSKLDSKLETLCSQIPAFRRENLAKNYIEAFSYDDVIRNKLAQCYSSPKDKLGAIVNTIDSQDETKVTLAEKFLTWCKFDLPAEVDQIFKEVFSTLRVQTVIKGRANNLTLNEIGGQLGVTRERVRQIESKAKSRFESRLHQTKIMSKIYADQNGKSIITKENIETVAGNNADELIFLLKCCSGSLYNFDQQLDVFIFGDNDLSSRIQDFMDSLPDILHKKDLDNVLKRAHDEYGIEKEYIRKALYEVYRSTGSVLHRTRLSLAKIYDAILRKYFPDGIYVYDDGEIEKLRLYINKEYGNIHLPTANHAVIARITSTCVLAGRGIYVPKKKNWVSNNLAKRMFAYIMDSKSPILLVGSVFSAFEDELIREGIDNRYFLQGVLHELFEDKLYFRRDYVSRDKTLTSIYSSIVSFIKESKYPVTKEEIKNNFKGITDIVIAFATSDSEVLNYFGEYLHASHLVIRETEKDQLATYLTTLLSDGEAHHIKEIYHTIHNVSPELFSRNAIAWPYSAFSFLEYLFSDQFQFSRPYIALKNIEIGRPNERLRESLYGMDTFPITAITEFAKENHMQIPNLTEFINSLNDKFLFLDGSALVSINEIGVNDSVARKVESCICKEVTGTVLIRDLKCINNLPKIKVPWNEWLIYSVLNKWSTRLEVSLSSSQLRQSLPLVAKAGDLDILKYKNTSIQPMLIKVDNMDNIDELLADILTDKLLEETE